ncbi:aminopeptidase P family protein [Rhodobacteraceae bacterium CCMM004]|nr:aminopeptidase P family protein [Rhodobacteraceae bacterium CCMM004]
MFQSFEAETTPETGPPRLAALRAQMAEDGLDAFLVPRADAHQGEHVAPCDARLAWLTGFTGSAGLAAVTAEAAGVFVDGRYRVQVKAQVADVFTPVDWPATQPGPWLAQRLAEGARVGFDPWLHTPAEIARLEAALTPAGIAAVPVANPLDAVWADRPDPPSGRAVAYPDDLAGATAAEKRRRIGAILAEAGQAAAVLTQPDSICWLLNIRGSDLPRFPVLQGFAIVDAGGAVRLFADPAKLADLADHLGPDVAVLPPASFEAAMVSLAGPVRVDRSTAPVAVAQALTSAGVEIAWGDDPCLLPKAAKTAAEIAATAEAHLRDGAAMVAFLAWLDGAAAEAAAGKRVTETDVVRALEGARRATNALKDISFDTIAGSGPNGAIVHYRVTEETDRALAEGDLLLVDSGGQYLDGTTDITRTVAVGTPSAEERACFTRVLRGMIAVSRLRWPRGLAGRDLDAVARAPLWMAGQDYDHGTGHGVGVYLGVHEGPQRLSRISEVALEPGMILSNEPGYYREGEFGIRIENLVAVIPAPPLDTADPGREMLAFRTLTWVPIDRRLIDVDALSSDERAWIDSYHAEVAARLADRVSGAVADWLARATAPL